MQRIPEPELMTTQEQVDAYAHADFTSGDARTVDLVAQLIEKTGPLPENPVIIDLGCGPGNIAIRLAEVLPNAQVVGIDGSEPMLAVASNAPLRRRARSSSLACNCRTLQLSSRTRQI